jgi:hypothetical protein
MAETALERFKTEQELKKERERVKAKEGEVKNLDQFQQSFLEALENISEPKKPVRYLKPFNIFQSEDKSLARFITQGSPNLQIFLNKVLSEKEGQPVDVMERLKDPEEKDYISILDEVRKGLNTGAFDLEYGLKDTLFTGLDYTFGSNFLEGFDEMMKDKKPEEPETWRGDLVALMTQFAIPGGIIQKVLNRTKTAGKIKKVIEGIKGSNKKKISKIAYRMVEGATIVGSTDFLASEPGRESFYFEPEDTKGKTGKERAAARFRNKIKYGQEGILIGGGFPLVGKGFQLGYKYGLAPFVKTTAKLGAKGINTAVFRPIAYLGSRELVAPVVRNTAKGIRTATDFTLTKFLAPSIVSAFSGKIVRQLPPFEQWRLRSIESPIKEERVLKRLDNILSYFRSYGKLPKDIEGVSEKVMLYIKGRARKLDRTMEGIDKKAYNLAKKFQNDYNANTASPSLQKHYLEQVDQYLRNQLKIDDLPKELQALSKDLKKEIQNTMEEFKKMLPKNKDGDKITNDLRNVEVKKVQSYLLKSFSTFTNPNYAPDEAIYNRAVKWVKDNVVKKDKTARINAVAEFGKKNPEDAYTESAKMLVESILRAGRAEGKNPLQQLKEIGKLVNFKNYKFMKTGDELPDAVKQLLGPEANLRASVSFTTSEMISALANKQAADYIANMGLKNGWLYRSIEEARNAGKLNYAQIMKMPRLGPHMKSNLTKLYADPDFVQAIQGVGGLLDNLINIPIYREIMQGKVLVQVGKTLYSPQTQVRNVSSAAFFSLMNGHIGGQASVTNAMKMVLDDIFKAGQKNIDEVAFNNYVEKLVRLGVWDENVVASELKAVMNQLKNNTIRTSDQLFDRLIKLAPTDKVARLYAGGDNLWKHYGFEYGRSQLSMALKNIDDVRAWYKDMGLEFVENDIRTGVKKTLDDHIDDASAWLLRNTYPTYSKVPPAIQNLRKLPLGAFISFPAEILRTGTNITATALKEMSSSNPAIRQMGIRRALGAFMTSYATGTGLVQIAQFLTNSTDSQWDAYKRSAAAPWDKNSSLLPIEGWKDGESAAINFSYFSPYDSLFAPLEAAINLAAAQKLNPQETDAYVMSLMFAEDGPVMTLLSPFITEPIGYDRLLDVTIRKGKKSQGGTVFSAGDDLPDKFAKSIAYILDGVKPGVLVSGDKIAGAFGKDLTKGGKPLNLKDELLALLAGTRIIRIDVKKDLKFAVSNMNRMLRAVDENEDFYNVDNYQNNTPGDMVKTFKKMQEEAFRIQKQMHITVKDLQLLDLDEDDIEEIMIKAGTNKKLAQSIIDGEFVPINFSKPRFETKVNTLETEVENFTGEKFRYRLNEEFVFPEFELEDVIDDYEDKEFFERGKEYKPEEFEYKLDKKGNILLDDNGNPVRDEGFIKSTLRTLTPIVKEKVQEFMNDYNMSEIKTPPLPNTPMPNAKLVANVPQKNQITGLTRNETALLSQEEQEIAKRT